MKAHNNFPFIPFLGTCVCAWLARVHCSRLAHVRQVQPFKGPPKFISHLPPPFKPNFSPCTGENHSLPRQTASKPGPVAWNEGLIEDSTQGKQ